MKSAGKHIDPALLGKYFSGDLTPDEREKVDAWIREDETNRDEFEKFRKLWNQAEDMTSGGLAPVNVNLAWSKLKTRIGKFSGDQEKVEHGVQIRHQSKNVIYLLSRIAAVLLTGLLVFSLYEWFKKPQQPVEIAAQLEIMETSLPDHSEVTLNKNSMLSYPKEFSADERRVELKGEAYFQVEKNEKKPFVIEAPDALIRVLGTSFNVKAFENDPEVTVTVKEGEVSLSDKDDIAYVVLGPNEKGVLNRDSGHIEKYVATDDSDLFWKTRTLVFRDTPLEKVFDIITKIYNVKIEVGNHTILQCMLTGKFQDMEAREILDKIALSFGLTVNYDNNTFVITGNGC